MRLVTLILMSGILLSCPGGLLALDQETKTKILIDEWSKAQKLNPSLPEEGKVESREPDAKAGNPKLQLPEVFDKKITLLSSGASLKTRERYR